MKPRIGAVKYLNARPLVYGLDRSPWPSSLRFDVPARCAELLHAGEIDIGLIPAIEYLAAPGYLIAPGIAIACDGPVASVALYAKVPVESIRTVALDRSSRTSAALLRILCCERFEISPVFIPCAPDLPAMLAQNDAALLIGDAALFADESQLGAQKIDLGAEWKLHTGLPFVWAFWAGRALGEKDCAVLSQARDQGELAAGAIAEQFAGGDRTIAGIAENYLRRNIQYHLGLPHIDALQRFYESACHIGAAAKMRDLRLAAR